MFMSNYRNNMKIIADLLHAADQSGHTGIKITSLLTKANLSHSRLGKFINNLTDARMITKIVDDKRNTFVITSRGKEYLKSYDEFSHITESFGLEL